MKKTKKWFETCIDMPKRIFITQKLDDPALFAYRNFWNEVIVERDIGAQETCHMLPKLPLVFCSRYFISLNVGQIMQH